MSTIRGQGGWGPADEQRLRAAWVDEPPRLDGPVRLAEYDPRWPVLYEREAARIRSVLGDRVLALEHVGSTSVPGLAAKPIIDILLVVADPADEPSYLTPLEQAGYRLVIREPGWYQHRALKGPDTDINLHVHPPGSPEIGRHLRFRDRPASTARCRAMVNSQARNASSPPRKPGKAFTTWSQVSPATSSASGVITCRYRSSVGWMSRNRHAKAVSSPPWALASVTPNAAPITGLVSARPVPRRRRSRS